MSRRVVVLGLDGATWELLDRLAKDGEMVNLKTLMDRSVHAAMASAHPPVTAPAWVSMATGVNPGRHGCFDFNKAEGRAGHLRPLQSWDIAEKTFYEILEERGRRTVLINLPVTYPPLTRQVTLTSLMTQGEEAVFPPDLLERHPLLAGYRCFPDTRLRAAGEGTAYLRDIRNVETARFDALRILWEEPWDLLFAVFSGSDWVSHEAFPAMAEGRYDEVPEALGMFHDLDRYVGWVAERLAPDDHLLLVSDHGFTAAKGLFYLNEWFEEEGLLRPDWTNPAFPPSHRMEAAALAAMQTGGRKFPPWVLSAVHRRGAARFFAKVYRKLGGSWPLSLGVDAAATSASILTAECHGVTLHGTGDPPAELLPKLEESLRSLRDPDGDPVFAAVTRQEEVYTGDKTNEAPQLLLSPDRWGLSAAVKALKNIPFVYHPTGIHGTTGIFLGHGPAFAAGRVGGTPLSVTDVAPLLFYLLGEAVPEGLDGALADALLAEGLLEREPPSYAPVEKPVRTREDLDAEAIQQRLKGLGYMG